MENKNVFLQHVREMVPRLLDLARNICYNKISPNLVYITTEINLHVQKYGLKNEMDYYVEMNATKKPTAELQDILNWLDNLYPDLYDVNLYIYKACDNNTIIDIRYLLKSSFKKDYYEKIKDRSPMLHTKIDIPPYACNTSDKFSRKFNINWPHQPLEHKWKNVCVAAEL